MWQCARMACFSLFKFKHLLETGIQSYQFKDQTFTAEYLGPFIYTRINKIKNIIKTVKLGLFYRTEFVWIPFPLSNELMPLL